MFLLFLCSYFAEPHQILQYIGTTTPIVSQMKTLRSRSISIVTFPWVSLKLLYPRLPMFPTPTMRRAKARETRFDETSRIR